MANRRNTTIRDRHRAHIAQGRPNCALCGNPIDWDAQYPDPQCFVVDHIIPLDAGGPDTLDNKAAAHAGCNWAKGKRAHAPIVKRVPGINW